MSPIIDVEPDVFDAASKVLGQKVTAQLVNAVTGLERALRATGGMAGTDPGGTTWAASYDHATAVTVGGMTDLANACYKLAAMLELTGFNHGRAESASDPTRTAPTPADTTKYAAPATLSCDPQPPSAHGGSGSPPRGWGLIEHLVGYVWPNGDQGKLRTAAQAWIAAANALDGAAYSIPEALHAIRGQQSPEVNDAATVCQAMMNHIEDVAASCRDLSTACSDYANHIDKAHKDIEDEVISLLEWTIAIEAGGAILGAFSFGLGEGAAQGVEAARIAATASRVASIISHLIELAGTIATRIGKVVTKIAEVAQRIKAILGARLMRATAEEAERLPGVAKDAETIAEESWEHSVESVATDDTVAGSQVSYADKASARQALDGNSQVAANRFFKGATGKSEDFQIADLQSGGHSLQFFSPADNAGYGKLYVQEIDSAGVPVREYKDTIGPNGFIERKWIRGGP